MPDIVRALQEAADAACLEAALDEAGCFDADDMLWFRTHSVIANALEASAITFADNEHRSHICNLLAGRVISALNDAGLVVVDPTEADDA